MEGNLAKLQGVLKTSLQKTGDFSIIKYKGGNEEKISEIVESLRSYFISKTFLVNGRANSKYAQEMQKITSLFIINTKFNKNDKCLLDIKEFSHLIKAIPTLSKCVLANIVIELDLAEYYCSIISRLPFQLTEELLSEIIFCLKQCEPKKALRDTHIFLDVIIKILTILNAEQTLQNEEIITQLTDIASEMLKNISGINSNWVEKWKASQVNEHIGHTTLSLLKLLRCCSLHTSSLSRIIDGIIRILITILNAVTINVFCVWAEVKQHDQPLQIVIAGEAYLAIEHLHKYKPAKELVQMLGNIAKKPKTINELILEADLETMIASINQCDVNQKLWFKAFINTSVLQNEEAITCLDKWASLCSQDDVIRLLNMSVRHKEIRIKKLILKCARSLSIEELALVSDQYLREWNTNNLETESLKNQLILLLNKTQNSTEMEETFIRDIYLLLLQNADFVITTLFMECLKKPACTHYLRKVFESIKTTRKIRDLSQTLLIKIFRDHPPTLEINACYKELLNTLLDMQYFPDKVVFCEIFMPHLQKYFEDNSYEMLLYTLQLLNLISVKHIIDEDALPTITLLVNVLEKTRCHFFTFSLVNQHIIQETTDLLMKYIPSSNDLCYIQCKDSLCKLELNNCINKFYFTNLYQELGDQLLTYIYPRYSIDNHAEVLANLIKLLPTCVTREWLLIAKELESHCGYQKTLLLLEDTLILLCQVTKSQPKDKEIAVNDGLKYCLQQYGIVIKDVLQLNHTSLEDETTLTKSVCNTLREIPDDIRKTEGLQLANLLSEQSLHSLKEDKQFVLSLVAIDDSTICQVLAQKMLS